MKKGAERKNSLNNNYNHKANTNKISLLIPIAILLAVVVLVIFLKPSTQSVSGKTVFTPAVPQTYSESSIRLLWDSMFKESSSGITINISGEDESPFPMFGAYKIKDGILYYLTGFKIFFFVNTDNVIASYVNMTPECENTFTNEESSSETHEFGGESVLWLPKECVNLRETAYDTSQAQSEFDSIFKATSENWVLNSTANIYGFMQNETIESEDANTTKIAEGASSLEYFISSLRYSEIQEFPQESCVPSWTPENTSCIDEELTTFYTDENGCETEEGKPQNETYSCNASLENIEISYINQTNVTASTLREFRINKDGLLRIIIYAEPSELSESVDTSSMELKIQKNGSTFGYTIINGIEYVKTVIVDKLDPDSSQVCIKDAHVSDISELSKPCNSDNESLVDCPGTLGQYSCEINESKFIVSGLTSSAVKEVTGNEIACTPVWNCTEWFPSACSSSEKQTRLCLDNSNCKTNAGKPKQSQECTSKSTSLGRAAIIKVIIFIIVLTIIIAAIITAVVIYQKKKHAEFQKPEVSIKEKSIGIPQPSKEKAEAKEETANLEEEITKPKEEAQASKKDKKANTKEKAEAKEEKGVNIKE